MATIEFDAGAAARLATAAGDAADVLRGQAGSRRTAAEHAADDFSGTYAARFTESAIAEAADRPKAATALEDLASQVRAVATQAAAEKKRLADLEAWQEREDARIAEAKAAAESDELVVPWLLTQGSGAPALFDPKPSEVAIEPVPIEATFSAQGRPRTGLGTGDGRSSADPEALHGFATTTRGLDTDASGSVTDAENAWVAFVSACAWAETGTVTVFDGIRRLLDENAADAAWVDSIADAFERAGGTGELSDATLDLAVADAVPAPFTELFDDSLTPSEVAELWATMGYTAADRRELAALPTSALSELGNLEGIPYWVRSTANVAVLDQRIAEANDFFDNMGLPAYQNAPDRARNARNIIALENIKASLVQGERAGARTLISLSDDEPPLAAVAIGDLDTATNVTWAVPGMGSSTREMTDWADSSQHIFDEQFLVGGPEDRAVIAWVGYEAPPVPVTGGPDLGVFASDYARTGGDRLAQSIGGLDAVRSGEMPTTNVVAHSYGTTTAAFGLTQDDVRVDTFTTIGSAGLPDSIDEASDINAGEVFAGQARNVIPFIEKGDGWAAMGREFSQDHHQDPTEEGFGATTFGADGSGTLQGVEDHGVHTDDSSGYLDRQTESLRNVAFATTGQGERMTEYTPLGLTPLEQGLLDSMGSQY